MATTLNLNSGTRFKLEKMLARPFKNIRQFWTSLALMIDQDTQLTFRHEGARAGRKKWAGFSPKTLTTKVGTKKIRYGTDLRPLPPDRLRALRAAWGWAHRGEMRKGVRRYSSSSKLLQASGLFRKSFGIIKMARDQLIYGTKHQLAEKIMGVKNRQVLFITPQDEQRYLSQFRLFYLKGLM
jgi:hypothetical protein